MTNQDRTQARYARKDITVTMEPWQNSGLVRYGLECFQCEYKCEFHFINLKGLSFATVGKLAGVFSLPCRRLAEEEARRNRDVQDGQLSLISDANDGWADPAISSCGVFTTRDGD